MVHCRYCGVLLLAATGLLLAGCSSTPSPPTPRAGWVPPPLVKAKPVPQPPAPEVDQNIVDAYAHYAQGLIYDMNDQPELAQEEMSKAALADPSNTDLVLDLSHRYLQERQPEKALEILIRASALPEASGKLFARLAMVYASLGKDPQAVEAAQTSIKRSPDSLEGYRMLYFIHLQRGRPKEALKILNQAAHEPGTTAEFDVELAELFAALERQAPSEKAVITTNALATLQHALDQNPTAPQLRLRMADAYGLLGDTTNAAQIYVQLQDALTEMPAALATVHEKLARIYLAGQNYAKASEQLEAIVQEDPVNPAAYLLLGKLADEQKKLQQAADYFEKAVLLNDKLKEAYYDLAQVQINLNQPQTALATLEKARAKFSAEFVTEVLVALAYEKQKDYTNAVSHFNLAEGIAKTNEPERLTSDFYFDQGAAYERAGAFEQAEQLFEKSLSLDPNSPEALNYLGYMLADRGVKLEKARDLIEKAVRLEPKSPAYLDSLGWVLYKLNRPQEALPQLQKAIELSEEPDPTLYDHLGDIYASLKQTDKAREAWNKSLALDPNELVRKKLGAAGGKASP
jgi:tetratricopeptide (TPR) repeat protein